MNKISVLPYWQLPDTIPSVYDAQSGSYQEMVAKVYGAMRTLQIEYNSFVAELNKTIEDFKTGVIESQEKFKECITKIMHDYIKLIDEKIKMQDLNIDEAIKYMKTNIVATTKEVIKESIENGDISIVLNYENETLYLTVTNGGEE